MSRKCKARSSPSSTHKAGLWWSLLLIIICQKCSNGPKFKTHHMDFQLLRGSGGNHSAMILCPLIPDPSLHHRWGFPPSHAMLAQPVGHCRHQTAGAEGREGFWHVCFQPDQCSNLFCPTATLISAPTERRWQQKWERRACCPQPGTGFSAYPQPLWHRQSQQERARRRCGDWCGCWIKQTFLAPLGNSCCKSQSGQHPLP